MYICLVKLFEEDMDFELGMVCFVFGYGILEFGSNLFVKLMIV